MTEFKDVVKLPRIPGELPKKLVDALNEKPLVEQEVDTALVYITVGNSDNKLTQEWWSDFVAEVEDLVRCCDTHVTVHGVWFSEPSSRHQNMCIGINVAREQIPWLKEGLRTLAVRFRQDSIAWAEASSVEFLKP